MNRLDPKALFNRIAADLPAELHRHLFVVGSLAAAYHFRAKLQGRAVKTKDADLVVHPAGDVRSCRHMAQTLLDLGWTRTIEPGCYPRPHPRPADQLRAIRLHPPVSHKYFLEFLNLPQRGQRERLRWIPVRLDDGWYGLPSFRFLGVAARDRQTARMGLEYASPSMMALANLLSHSTLDSGRIEGGEMENGLRSAKDLGRAIALARLAGRKETERWPRTWFEALKDCFPGEWPDIAGRAGDGLRELLSNDNALDEACRTTNLNLLSGMNVTTDKLRASAKRLLFDVLDPLADIARDERE